ncbi:MAG TPA: TonB-dependent receptor [Opitutaceae bacterium]
MNVRSLPRVLAAGGIALASAAVLSAQAVDPATPAAPADDDVLSLNEFVVTGTVTPTSKLESPLAVTTLDRTQLTIAAPRSTADALKLIPGFYLESSGGEANNNLFSRGVAAEGGYEYVAIHEDGLPVIFESNMSFSPADNYTRITNWVANIEALRGGSAGIFQSSAPVGIINFISREGTATQHGEVLVQTSDYGTMRTELWTSGPLGKNTTYAVGGFYRVDDGIRDRGYTANKGGQLAANVRHDFANERGYFKISGKVLDDRTAFELPIPLANPQDPQTIPGGPDIHDGAAASRDIRYFTFSGTPDGNVSWDLADGIQVELAYIGTELDYELAEGLRVVNRNRYTAVDKAWNANPLGNATPLQTIANSLATSANADGQFAAALDPATGNYRFRLSTPGNNHTIVAANAAEAAGLNGNGLGIDNNFWHSAAELKNFQNDLRLIKELESTGTTISAGFYYSYMEDDRYWQWNRYLTDVSGDYHRLDVTYLDAAGNSIGQGTYNGISQVGTFHRRFSGEETDTSLYANVEQKWGKFHVDAGYRYERLEAEGSQEGLATYDLNQPGGTNPALRGATFGNGNYTPAAYTVSDHAVTAGVNYTFTKRAAVFARISDGYRLPDTDNLSDAAGAGTDDPGPTIGIRQYEVGVKYSRSNLAFFLTAFATRVDNQLFSDFVLNPDGSVGQQVSRLGIDIDGLELESIWTPLPGLSVSLTGTLQNPEFSTDNFVSGTDASGNPVSINIKGNQPVRIPKEFLTLTTAYTLPALSWGTPRVHATWQYVGDRYSDQANLGLLEGFSEFAAGASLALTNGFTIRVQCSNLFNGDGITEGDPRAGQTIADPGSTYSNFRPILPRSIVASVSYEF